MAGIRLIARDSGPSGRVDDVGLAVSEVLWKNAFSIPAFDHDNALLFSESLRIFGWR